MWKPYLELIKKHCTRALNILDRFHIVVKMNLALDDVRAAEVRRMAQEGYEPVLKRSRWCLLTRPENLTDWQHRRWGQANSPARCKQPSRPATLAIAQIHGKGVDLNSKPAIEELDKRRILIDGKPIPLLFPYAGLVRAVQRRQRIRECVPLGLCSL